MLMAAEKLAVILLAKSDFECIPEANCNNIIRYVVKAPLIYDKKNLNKIFNHSLHLVTLNHYLNLP